MIVTDASVWVSALFATDAFHTQSEQWAQRQLSSGQVFVVPSIFLAEIAGAVSRRSGDPSLGQSMARRISTLMRFDIRVVDRNLAIRTADLAAALSLKGADAIYVALAQQSNLPLVTWDREQFERGATIINVSTPDADGDPSGAS